MRCFRTLVSRDRAGGDKTEESLAKVAIIAAPLRKPDSGELKNAPVSPSYIGSPSRPTGICSAPAARPAS